jgi:response regulator of citrate/malate metabolism
MQAILERLRAEFLEMPGLRLTADQVHRLCGVERMTCRAVLDALVDEKFLCAKADGTYARLTEGDAWHHRPAS